MAIPKSLRTKIETFLAEKSASQGGYAPVGEKDLEALAEILNQLVAEKYEQDPDGDLPVAFDLLDRTRYQRSYYAPVPHMRDEDHGDLRKAYQGLRSALANLATAQREVDQAMRVLEFDVMEPVARGNPLKHGTTVLEPRSAFTDHSLTAQAAATGAMELVRGLSVPVDADRAERNAWTEAISKQLSEQLGTRVGVRLLARKVDDDGCVRIGLTLLGLAEEDPFRTLTVAVPQTAPRPKKPSP